MPNKIWECKVGEVDASKIPSGGDAPMRKATEKAYEKLTGVKPIALFSGWGSEWTTIEKKIIYDEIISKNDLIESMAYKKSYNMYCILRDCKKLLEKLNHNDPVLYKLSTDVNIKKLKENIDNILDEIEK